MEESSRIDRAKQFLAFDTLKGLQKELREKEAEIERERLKDRDLNKKSKIFYKNNSIF